jgi:hypothetical protein
MSASAETIALLTSIDASLKELLALSKSKRAKETPVDLDGPHGNPEIRAKDPRDYTGPSMMGKRFSECPAAYLDLLADRYDYFATKETDATKKRYTQLDAARARGWAARVRENGPIAPSPVLGLTAGFPSDAMTSDDISF